MPIALALSDARTEVIHLAAIDGKTGSNGRHSPTRLNAILNRKYRALRTRVSQLRYPQFLVPGSITPMPARASGEDYIELPMPAGVAELAGVDVKVSNEWKRLDPTEFGQRRDAPNAPPPSGVGFWAVLQPPVPSTTTITAGKAAIWPATLAGSYRLFSVETWADITTDSHVFMIYEGWDEWLLNAAAMACATRDGNKRGNYETCRDAWLAADALVVAGAARFGPGYTEVSSYQGIQL